jgi:hypothetical protein
VGVTRTGGRKKEIQSEMMNGGAGAEDSVRAATVGTVYVKKRKKK